MTTPEKTIEKYLVKLCRENGRRCLKVRTVGRKGFPDRMIPLGQGRVLFVETKRPVGGVVSSAQKREWKRLRAEGFVVEAARSKSDVEIIVGLWLT